MLPRALLVAILVACHPDAERVQRPAQSDANDDTAKAAKRWIYASYFNRLKRKVADAWHPNKLWRRIDPTRTVYGPENRVTEVRVSLSRSGELTAILVISPSGVMELDDEALHAFRVAAPFGPLPEGLAGRDGQITFQFSFSFQVDGQRLQWRLPET
jgi:TonB family protein